MPRFARAVAVRAAPRGHPAQTSVNGHGRFRYATPTPRWSAPVSAARGARSRIAPCARSAWPSPMATRLLHVLQYARPCAPLRVERTGSIPPRPSAVWAYGSSPLASPVSAPASVPARLGHDPRWTPLLPRPPESASPPPTRLRSIAPRAVRGSRSYRQAMRSPCSPRYRRLPRSRGADVDALRHHARRAPGWLPARRAGRVPRMSGMPAMAPPARAASRRPVRPAVRRYGAPVRRRPGWAAMSELVLV